MWVIDCSLLKTGELKRAALLIAVIISKNKIII